MSSWSTLSFTLSPHTGQPMLSPTTMSSSWQRVQIPLDSMEGIYPAFNKPPDE